MDKITLRNSLQDAKNGNSNLLNQLVRHYQQDIYRNSKLYSGNKELAKTITKNTITKVFTHLDDALAHVDDFGAWLSKETMHKAIESLLPFNPMEEGISKEVGLLDDENKWAQIFCLNDGLTDTERTILNLSAIKGMGVEEIKNLVHLSKEDVETVLSRAKNHLNLAGSTYEEYSNLLPAEKLVPFVSQAAVERDIPEKTKVVPTVSEEKSEPVAPMVKEEKAPKKKGAWKSSLLYVLAGILILVAEWFALDYFLGNKNKQTPTETDQTQETTTKNSEATSQNTETKTPSTETTTNSSESTNNTTTAPAAPQTNYIGKLTVTKSGLHVRDQASTSGKDLGTLNANDSFDVLESTQAGGYTWYRIGEGRWVANPQGYVNFIKK